MLVIAGFRCLNFAAMKSVEINKGKIASHDSSGTVGVGVGNKKIILFTVSLSYFWCCESPKNSAFIDKFGLFNGKL